VDGVLSWVVGDFLLLLRAAEGYGRNYGKSDFFDFPIPTRKGRT
jgi:hypothetical protein